MNWSPTALTEMNKQQLQYMIFKYIPMHDTGFHLKMPAFSCLSHPSTSFGDNFLLFSVKYKNAIKGTC